MPGAAIIYIAVLVVFIGSTIYRRRFRPREQRFFRKATIAYNAGPLVNRHVTASTTLWVTGNDGLAVHKEGYIWAGYLKKWLDRGATINYLLMHPTSEAIAKLDDLRAEHQAGQLHVYLVDWPKVPTDGADFMTLQKMKTFHFLLADRPKMMWIERVHLPGTCEATDCEFVPPEIAERDDRYVALKGYFDMATERYARERTSTSEPASMAAVS